MSLYPTKIRLALLADVAEGRVWHHPSLRTLGEDYIIYETSRISVTARMAEFSREGWVTRPIGFRWTQYELTDAGRAVLEGGAS